MEHQPKAPATQRQRGNAIPANSHRKSLSAGQLTAISLLLAGHSVASIARNTAISQRTLFRWKVDPRFDAELRRRAATVAIREPVSPSAPRPVRRGRRPSWARGLSAEEEAELRADAAKFDALFDKACAKLMPQSPPGAHS